ncbi:MAG TPA: putative lipid II flippase FtsW, partial [Solirubrobacteraceae bacterium]|nr:putative lipid II flippase FtsW [Solirubrobacteraceae bacterium]
DVEPVRVSRRRSPSPRRAPEQSLEHRILLTATLCLLAGGAVMVYSASSARTLLAGQGDGTTYLVKYLLYGTIGFVVLHVATRVSLDYVRRLTPILLGIAFFLCLLVKVPGVGVEVNGATRWLGAGPIQFQPSELMKLALVLYAAHLLALRPQIIQSVKEVASPLLLVTGAAAALIASQPDLGTALVCGFAMAALLVASGMPVRVLAILGGTAVGAILMFAMTAPYRRARLTAFLDPWADAGAAGFQSVQGQIAIGSGGLFGKGLGESVQKIFYLPEAHTDFILAVIGEELGVAGVLGLLFLYGLIAYAGLRAAKMARGPYAQLLATGITSLILCQALLNVFTVLGLAPLTGVPLPFISSGSSSLLVLLAGMGLLLNVANGGRSDLKAVRGPNATRSRGAGRDRSGRDSGPRRAGARSGRRAAG